MLVTAALTVVLLELALWVAIGTLWWLAVNLLLVLVLLGSLRWILSWWRKQLAATPAAPGRTTPARGPLGRLNGSKASGSQPGGLLGRGQAGSGRGRLSRLFGGSGKSGGSPRSGGTTGSGRRSGLGRLLSGGRRTGSGTAGRSGTGSGRSGLRGLLGGRKAAGGVARSGGTTGRTGSAGGGARRGGALGRMRSAGRGLLGRASSRPSSTKRPNPASAGRPSSKSRTGQSGIAKFLKGVRDGAAAANQKSAPEAAKPEPAKPEPKPAQKPAHRNDAERKPSPQPRATPKESPTMVQHQDDVSLQRWGRNLTTVSPAIEELAKQADSQGQLAGAVATAVGKLAAQGDDELPAAKTVTAEAAAIAAELKQVEAEQAAAAQKLRALMGRADALGASYKRNHEVDEARLAGERGGRHRERRADVGVAEQDT